MAQINNASTHLVDDNSNVKFLLGTQDALEGYITGSKQASNGTFYLTKDTHRLYVGTKDKVAVPVNEGVISVDSVDSLPGVGGSYGQPHPGEFYYAKAENILCVYSGPKNPVTGTGGWVQINNNTNTYIAQADTSIVPVTGVTTAFKVLQTLTYNNNTTTEDHFIIDTAGGVSATVSPDGKTLTLTGAIIKQFNTKATADSKSGTVELEDSKGNKAAFNINGGSNVTVTKSASGSGLDINVTDMTNTGVSVTPGTDTNKTGFIVGVSDIAGSVETQFDPVIRFVENKGDSAKQKNVDIHFQNNIADLPVYTRAEIDAKYLALNAMTYMGLVGASANTVDHIQAWSAIYNQQNTHHIGDTYLFSSDVTYIPAGSTTAVTIKKGSLAIARGTENANGTLTTPQWDIVADSGDTDTKYKLVNTSTTRSAGAISGGGTVNLIGVLNNTEEDSGTLTFADGTSIKVDVAAASANNKNATITVTHADVAKTTSKGSVEQNKAAYASSTNRASADTTLTVVESVTTNAQGHVTGVKTNTVTLRDTNATVSEIKTVASAIAADKRSATMTQSITLIDGTGTDMDKKSSNWTLASESLQFSKNATGDNVKVDLVWGTFE